MDPSSALAKRAAKRAFEVRSGHERRAPGSELSLEDALRKMRVAERLIGGHTVEVETEGVLRLADASGRSSYDAEYVKLAEDLGLRLLTTDGPVLEAFPDVAVHPRDFAG